MNKESSKFLYENLANPEESQSGAIHIKRSTQYLILFFKRTSSLLWNQNKKKIHY